MDLRIRTHQTRNIHRRVHNPYGPNPRPPAHRRREATVHNILATMPRLHAPRDRALGCQSPQGGGQRLPLVVPETHLAEELRLPGALGVRWVQAYLVGDPQELTA